MKSTLKVIVFGFALAVINWADAQADATGCYLSPSSQTGALAVGQTALEGRVIVDSEGFLVGAVPEAQALRLGVRRHTLLVRCNEAAALELVIFEPDTRRVSHEISLRSFVPIDGLLDIPGITRGEACATRDGVSCLAEVAAELDRAGYRVQYAARVEDGTFASPTLLWIATRNIEANPTAENIFAIGLTSIASSETNILTLGLDLRTSAP